MAKLTVQRWPVWVGIHVLQHTNTNHSQKAENTAIQQKSKYDWLLIFIPIFLFFIFPGVLNDFFLSLIHFESNNNNSKKKKVHDDVPLLLTFLALQLSKF